MQSNIPNSDSKLGKKSAIHQGEIASQSIIDGWPITKYPYSQSAEPNKQTSHPTITVLVKRPLP